MDWINVLILVYVAISFTLGGMCLAFGKITDAIGAALLWPILLIGLFFEVIKRGLK